MRQQIKTLREERAKLVEDARALLESDEFSAEDETRFDEMMAEADKKKSEIDRLERLLDAEQDVNEPIERRSGREDPKPQNPESEDETRASAHAAAFDRWMRFGFEGLDEEQRQIMMANRQDIPEEARAQGVGTGAIGGFTVPEDFRNNLESALKAFGGMRAARTEVINSTTGANLPMPTEDDTNNKGAIINENTAATEQDITFGATVMSAYMYTSRVVRVSLQLMQDSAFDMDGFLPAKLGERLGRITNEHFTTGTGVDQPNGIVTAAPVGKQGTTGQTTSVIYDDLVDLEHSVDPAYRMDAEWMLNDDSIRVIKKLKDADGRPLWAPGIAVREPDTIIGYPYVPNQDMPVMAANAKSILFGDFSKYFIRDVMDVMLLRLTERYAEFAQVGFLAFSRHDGELLDAGTGPIKAYQNSAT